MDSVMREVCTKVFGVVDKNGKGKLSRDQMSQSLRLLGLNPTDEQIQHWLDPLNTLEFNYEQYMKLVTHILLAEKSGESAYDMRKALVVFDTESTGCIDKRLLFEVLTQHGSMKLDPEDASSMVEELDYRRDGQIRISELEIRLTSENDVTSVLNEQQWDHV